MPLTRIGSPRRWLSLLLTRLAGSYAFNAHWREHNRDLLVGAQQWQAQDLVYRPPPAAYPEVAPDAMTDLGRFPHGPPLFISARFRSGSTLLWNLFRHTPGITAYYEPLNERRWFQPRRAGEGTDPTHVNVADYWQEYAGLADLDAWFHTDWTTRNLYLGAQGCDRHLQCYLAALIARAPARAVLQCNRLDFRLAWLRRQFPGAGILVLYRHPREQWLSVLRGRGHAADHCLPDGRFEDHFYTLAWARDLCRVFPCLEPARHTHVYAIHYLLWRLSLLAAERDADLLIAYEDLIADCAGTLARVFARFAINAGVPPNAACARLLKTPTAPRWPAYAAADWFAAIEQECEALLRLTLADAPAG